MTASWLQVLLPLNLDAEDTVSDPPLAVAVRWLAEQADAAPQPALAGGALFLGAVFVSVGGPLMKPLFVTSCAAACGWETFVLCQLTGNAQLIRWALLVAGLIGGLSLKLWNLAYPAFLFIIGCMIGGTTVFLLFTRLVAQREPASLLGATVMAALVLGLSFLRCHGFWWRLLTPPSGGLLVAASLRFFAMFLADRGVLWTEFSQDIAGGLDSALDVSGAIMWTAWVVLTLLGWYLQIGVLIGLRKRKPLLPPWMYERFSGTLSLFGIGQRGIGKTDSGSSLGSARSSKRFAQSLGELEAAGQPLLEPAAQDTDQVGTKLVPKLVSVTKEAGVAFMKEDHRPEVALLVAVVSVVSLNGFLAKQPPLFLGHAVLMSTAFLPFATAGMVSYASTSLLLPSLFTGPRRSLGFRKHWSHGAFNGFSLACALGGYACIYAQHQRTGESQLGLDQVNNPARLMHVWIGYAVLTLMLLQSLSGIAKLYFLVLTGERHWNSHNVLGRMSYCLAALNQLIAYTFPGLVPVWATPMLAAMLMITVGATLFFLQEKQRMEEASQRLEAERQRYLLLGGNMDKNFTNSSFGSQRGSSNRGGSRSGYIAHTHTSVAALAAAEKALARNHNLSMLQRSFAEWHRGVQKQRLEDVVEAMEGQDRLVQFLSSEMVDHGVSER